MSSHARSGRAISFERVNIHAGGTDRRAAEQAAGRRAVQRAVRMLVGPQPRVMVAHPPRRAPSACVDKGERVWISLTHRDGWAVAACSRAPIGVDLERLTDIADTSGDYFLSESERREFAGLPLVTLWSLKEAAWKALALTDDVPFRALTLRGSEQRLSGVEIDGHAIAATGSCWQPASGWVLSLVQLERGR